MKAMKNGRVVKHRPTAVPRTNPLGRRLIQSLKEAAATVENGQLKTLECEVQAATDLRPRDYSPQMVRTARRILGTTTDQFAQYMGVSNPELKAWESGKKNPPSPACRLMDEVHRDPAYWQRRLMVV